MVRLFQRAGAWGAASVALFFSALVNATNPAVNIYNVDGVTNADGHFEARYHIERRFAANDPTNPGGRDFVTKKVAVPKRGNPMNWVKKTPFELGVTAAVAGLGWAIDDLTNQVTKPNYSEPEGYESGGYYRTWGNNDYADWSAQGSCSKYDPNATIVFKQSNYQGHDAYWCGAKTTSWVWCSDSTALTGGLCDPGYSPEPEVTWEPVPDVDLWKEIDKVVDASPDYWKNSWVKDEAGNPYIYPEPAAARDAEAGPLGVDPYPEAVKVNDPLAGRGLGPDGLPTAEPSPTPEVAKTEPFEIPDDYAREDTLKDIWKWLEIDPAAMPEPAAEPMAEPITKLDEIASEIENQGAELGDLPLQSEIGQLSGGGQCPTFQVEAPMGQGSITLDQHCGFYQQTLMPVLNWMLYMATGIYLFFLYREETTRPI